MRRTFAWSLAALWVGACAIPNLEVDESFDDSGSNDNGGTSSNAGTKNASAGTKSGSAGTKSNSGDGGTGNSQPSDGGSDSGVIDEGGAPTGGTNTNPSGGSRPTAGTSSGGSGGSSPASGSALAKFCNAVSYQGADADFELHIGSGATEVVLTTLTGTCTPVVNKNCVAIPTGTDVPINVYFAGDTDPYWIGSATIAPGEAWIFAWVYDEAADEPKVIGNGDYTSAECKSTDYDELASTATPP